MRRQDLDGSVWLVLVVLMAGVIALPLSCSGDDDLDIDLDDDDADTGDGDDTKTDRRSSARFLPAPYGFCSDAERFRSAHNLHLIAMATMMWVNIYEGHYPPSLEALAGTDLVQDPVVFVHPSRGPEARRGRFVTDYDSTLDRADFALTEEKVPEGSLPLAWERHPFHRGGRNVAYFDGHVKLVPEREFPDVLRKVDKWIAENREGAPKKRPWKKTKKRDDIRDVSGQRDQEVEKSVDNW